MRHALRRAQGGRGCPLASLSQRARHTHTPLPPEPPQVFEFLPSQAGSPGYVGPEVTEKTQVRLWRLCPLCQWRAWWEAGCHD